MCVTIYSFWLWYNLKYDVSKHTSGFGQPGWAVNSETFAGWAAMRYLVSAREQSSILQDYKGYRDMVPNATLSQFLLQRHPQLITGHYTSPTEFLSALSAVHAWEKDRYWVSRVFRQSGYGDLPSKIDKVMEALRRDYAPSLSKGTPFPAAPQSSPIISMAQQQYQQQQQQGGGGGFQPQPMMMYPSMHHQHDGSQNQYGSGTPMMMMGSQHQQQSQPPPFMMPPSMTHTGMTIPPPAGLHSTPRSPENSTPSDINISGSNMSGMAPFSQQSAPPSTGGGTVPFQ